MFYNYYFFAITQTVNPKDYFSNRPLRGIPDLYFQLLLIRMNYTYTLLIFLYFYSDFKITCEEINPGDITFSKIFPGVFPDLITTMHLPCQALRWGS